MKKVKKLKQKPIFTDLTLKGLKQEVISRGMEFDKVLSSSIPDLQNWLYNNFKLEKDRNLIVEYDEYIEQLLRDVGSEDMIYPSLRLSYVGDKAENFGTLEKKPKRIKPRGEKVIKEKTEDGIYSGTKKALTYECFNKGISIEETIEKVKEKFSDASEKSIKIWFRKAGKIKS